MASGLSAQEYSGESVPKALRTAKTVYIVNNGASRGYAGAVEATSPTRLLQWGRFTVVDSVAALLTSPITIGKGKHFEGLTVTRSEDQKAAFGLPSRKTPGEYGPKAYLPSAPKRS